MPCRPRPAGDGSSARTLASTTVFGARTCGSTSPPAAPLAAIPLEASSPPSPPPRALDRALAALARRTIRLPGSLLPAAAAVVVAATLAAVAAAAIARSAVIARVVRAASIAVVVIAVTAVATPRPRATLHPARPAAARTPLAIRQTLAAAAAAAAAAEAAPTHPAREALSRPARSTKWAALPLAATERSAATRDVVARAAAATAVAIAAALTRAVAIARPPLPHHHPPRLPLPRRPLEGIWRHAAATAPRARVPPPIAIAPRDPPPPTAAVLAARMTSAEGSIAALDASPAAIKRAILQLGVSTFN